MTDKFIRMVADNSFNRLNKRDCENLANMKKIASIVEYDVCRERNGRIRFEEYIDHGAIRCSVERDEEELGDFESRDEAVRKFRSEGWDIECEHSFDVYEDCCTDSAGFVESFSSKEEAESFLMGKGYEFEPKPNDDWSDPVWQTYNDGLNDDEGESSVVVAVFSKEC